MSTGKLKEINTTTNQQASNRLVYKVSKVFGEVEIEVKIKLSDDHKNGHQDFSITGNLWEAGKPKIDRYLIGGGCIHDSIEKYFPEFIPFIRLHLCDYKGAPCFAASNMLFHLQNGFNQTKKSDPSFKKEFCKYYRVTEDQFDNLNEAENKIQISIMLQDMGIVDQWQKQADEAIAYLERLTSKKFLVDSKKSHFTPPTDDQLREEREKQKSGYYSAEQKYARKMAQAQKMIDELDKQREEELAKINLEYDIKKQVLKAGGKRALDRSIFYNHDKTLSFNYSKYEADALSDAEIDQIVSLLNLPEGVSVRRKDK